MNPSFVAADVRRLKLLGLRKIKASLRRLLRFRGSMREDLLGGILSMNHASPGLRPPSPRHAGRGQGEGCRSGSWSQCMRKNERRLLMNVRVECCREEGKALLYRPPV